MSKKMKRYISEAVEDLIKSFDAEFGSGKHKETSDPLHYPRHSHHLDSDEEESSCDSSFNQVFMMFFQVSKSVKFTWNRLLNMNLHFYFKLQY